ncbi:prolipoprotein diacylglyceryl transferase [Arcanobacterium hippocoleae]|nr:prolipoprotein diacylglyceryl transferase [Arcanobacterium hippocoleae]
MHFEWLTSIPSPPINLIYLGPIPLRFYALSILTGIILALLWTDRRYRRIGGPEDIVIDVGTWAVLIGIVGARIYHVITSPAAYFGEHGDIWQIFRIWEGGLGIWGGIAFGAVTAAIVLHRRNLRVGAFADAAAPTILVAQGIGRFGNYFNQEIYGLPTDLPWALEIDAAHIVGGYPPGTTFHPTFLYEALWCFAGAGLLLFLQRRFRLDGGRLMIIYVMYYTLGRVWIEMLRIDDAQIIAGLRLNVWTSIFVFLIASIAYLLYSRRLANQRQLAEIYLAPVPQNDEKSAAEMKDKISAALAEAENRYSIG